MRGTAGVESRSAPARSDFARSAAGGVAAWLRSLRVSWFTVLMILVVVLFVIIIAPGLRVYVEQQQQIADLRAEVAAAEAQNTALQGQVARWGDPAYVRAQARDRLYYVMPGETSLLVLNDIPSPPPGAQPDLNSAVQNTRVDWLSTLFVSGMTAGLTTSTPEQLEQSGQLAPGAGAPAEQTQAPAP